MFMQQAHTLINTNYSIFFNLIPKSSPRKVICVEESDSRDIEKARHNTEITVVIKKPTGKRHRHDDECQGWQVRV
jgi:hypothetical protein